MGMSAVTAYVQFILKTLAERDAGPDCLALRVRKMGPRIDDIHPVPLEIRTVDIPTMTVQ